MSKFRNLEKLVNKITVTCQVKVAYLGVSRMPHLTPIRWLIAIISVWTLISIINIQQWRNKPIKFNKPNTSRRSIKKSKWLW